MPSLNSSFLLGPLTRPPTFHQTARGMPVTSFDLQVGVLGAGRLLLAWVRGLAYRDALGWLVLLLGMGVLVSAIAKRTRPRWRR